MPRTVTEGDRALYTALYPTRFALASSDPFARQLRACSRSPIEDIAAFHVVFGKTVPDVSLNAVANLGYAEGRFLLPVYPGDTLTARARSSASARPRTARRGSSGCGPIGRNQRGEAVLATAAG